MSLLKMDPEFWLQKWQQKDIAFHQKAANSLLVSCFNQLDLAGGSRVFLPLCGKTPDIGWLLANGYRVAGAELSEIAVTELFQELGIAPNISAAGKLKHYAADKIDIFVGNIFDLTATELGTIDAIYDRAALVALPDSMRTQYAKHLLRITDGAPQLAICFEYEQALVAGPPFSIDRKEMNRLYADIYQLQCVESIDVAGGLKRKCPATEHAWLLAKR